MNQTQSQHDPLLVDARTAAKLLGVSPRSLYSLLQRGELPSVRIGTRRLFSRDVLARWIEERLSTDPPTPRRRKTDGQQDGQSAQRGKAQRGQQRP